MNTYPPAVQRPEMLLLSSALKCQDKALRRDDCGDWRISGARGHIYAVPQGYLLVVESGSARLWTATKARLSFAQLRNDGDDEGTFILDRLPTTGEAEHIRQALKVRKRKEYGSEYLGLLRERAVGARLAA